MNDAPSSASRRGSAASIADDSIVQRAYHRPDAPTFPPVAAGEAVVGISLPAIAVVVGRRLISGQLSPVEPAPT